MNIGIEIELTSASCWHHHFLVRGKIVLILLTNKLLKMQFANFNQTKATRCVRDVFRRDTHTRSKQNSDTRSKQNSDGWVLFGLFVRPLWVLY